MRIGIDIDDTITYSSDTFLEYAKRYNKEKSINFVINENTLDVKMSYGWKDDNLKEFLSKYLVEILDNTSPKEDAIDIINKLKLDGNQIYFITARGYKEIDKDMYKLTRDWLYKHKFKYDQLIINSKTKIAECKKYKIDVFIDDNYQHCKSIKENLNIPVYLFATRYNKDINDKSIKKVNNWFEIYDCLEKEVFNNENKA